MKFITIFLLSISYLLTPQAYAIGASGHASVHASASSHVAAHEVVAARAIPTFVAGHAAQATKSQNGALIPPVLVKGVLTCHASYKSVGDSDGFNYEGCYIGSWSRRHPISIEEFFKQFKPAEATKISMVIFSDEGNRFEIYYE